MFSLNNVITLSLVMRTMKELTLIAMVGSYNVDAAICSTLDVKLSICIQQLIKNTSYDMSNVVQLFFMILMYSCNCSNSRCRRFAEETGPCG